MKWPQVALWIQRGNSNGVYNRGTGNGIQQQLAMLEENASKNMKEWMEFLVKELQIESNIDNVPWVKDIGLKKFFENENQQDIKLSQAVGIGLY